MFGFPLARRAMIHRHRLELLRAQQAPAHGTSAPDGPQDSSQNDAPALALRLPEPHRLYALALLCRLQDAPRRRSRRCGRCWVRSVSSTCRIRYAVT
ncbi:hypothetical protein [Deinococcus aquaticus]|uniref:hypothetical protein n=1 Tax=Deinococcus aquaticus TaxID=328692 RepID=UPI00361634AA